MPLELPVLITDVFGRSFQIHDAPLPARHFRGPRIGFPHAQAAQGFIEQGDLEPGAWSLILLYLFGDPDWSSGELIERAAEVLIEGRLWVYPLSPGPDTRLPRILHNTRGEAYQIQNGDPREASAQGPAEHFADFEAARGFVEAIEADAETWRRALGLAAQADLDDLDTWLAQAFYEGELTAHRYRPHPRTPPCTAPVNVDPSDKKPPGEPPTQDKALTCEEPASNGQGRPCPGYENETRIAQVSMVTGEALLRGVDYRLPGPLGFSCTRYYRSGSGDRDRGLGYGWSATFTECLHIEGEALWLEDAQGRHIRFAKPAPGASSRNIVENLILYREDAGYRIHRRNHADRIFASRPGGQAWPLTQLRDRHANRIDFHYEGERLVRITSSWGRTLSLTHDAQGRIGALIAHDAEDLPLLPPLARFEYDTQGRLIQITDRAGHREVLEYEAHILSTLIDKSGVKTVFEWNQHDADALCLKCGDADGGISYRFGWDLENHRASHTDALGHSTHYHHAQGRLVERIDAEGYSARYTYDKSAHPHTCTDALDHTETFDYDAHGRLKGYRNALNQTLSWDYDVDEHPRAMHDAAGHTWQLGYDANGALTALHTPAGDAYRCRLDARGLPVALIDAEGHERALTWNERAECTRVIDARGHATTFAYDALGLASRIEHALGHCEFTRDAMGRIIEITDSDGATRQFEYDARGRLILHRDALGHATRRRYRRTGTSLISEQEDALGHKRRREYDTAGRLSVLINENGERQHLEYDDCDRLIRHIGVDGREQRYDYDAAGRLVYYRDADERFIEYQRDALGRATRRYSAEGVFSDFEYDAPGHLIKAAVPWRETRFAYDPRGCLTEERILDTAADSAGEMHHLRHACDRNARRIRTQSDTNTVLEYTRDAEGDLSTITFQGTPILHIERDARGREVERVQGGTRTCIDYDPRGRIRRLRLTACDRDAPLMECNYVHDAAGRIIVVHDREFGERRLEYDALDRVIRVVDEQGEQRFAYDPAGNPLEGEEPVSGNRLMRYAGRDFTYDPNGNVIGINAAHTDLMQLDYNTQNQLIGVEQNGVRTEYVYDALGRRIQKRRGQDITVFHWDGAHLFSETGPTGERIYIREPDSGRPAAFVQEARLYFIHLDQRNAPLAVTDETGRLVWRGYHDIHARLIGERGEPIDMPLRAYGHYHDEESALHYLGRRYYDPLTGRCLQQDDLALRRGANPYRLLKRPLRGV